MINWTEIESFDPRLTPDDDACANCGKPVGIRIVDGDYGQFVGRFTPCFEDPDLYVTVAGVYQGPEFWCEECVDEDIRENDPTKGWP